MPPAGPAPPRVSRETRLLLLTALVALAVLWALARIRFPDRPVSPNPLPPVLTQLASRSPFEEIPALVADVTPRLASSIVPVPVEPARPDVRPVPGVFRPGLRVAEELAVVLLEEAGPTSGDAVVVQDPVSGLAVVRVQRQLAVEPGSWTPRRLDLPRYLLAADVVADTVSWRPVFVGPLLSAHSEVWGDTIWLMPPRTEFDPGDLAFTIDGAFAGLVTTFEKRPALVPAQTVLSLANRLMREPPAPAAELGVHVHAMSAAVARATGAAMGVVVTHVEPDGPAAPSLQATDVIEAADDLPITTVERWRTHVGRLAPGSSVTLRVRRAGATEDVVITARSEEGTDVLPHGLTMRTLSGIGAEVVRVDARSAAARAGVQPGDVIRVFNGIRSPTPAQVARAFSATPEEQPVLVAITRGGDHHVLTIQRRR